MVITDVPFETKRSVRKRYQNMPITEGSSGTSSPASVLEYTRFLKEKDRKCNPEGFLDSSKYTHTYFVNKQTAKSLEPPPTSYSLSAPNIRSCSKILGVTSVGEKAKETYDKQMKMIEAHMWNHKQKERELKRVENDIKHNQQNIRQMLRSYEAAIHRKKFAEEQKLSNGMKQFDDLQNEYYHRKKQKTKLRTREEILFEQSTKDQGRKTMTTINQLATQFRNKRDEMDIKRTELDTIIGEYQEKVRENELAQYELKQQLSELALALNMEAQKGRTQDSEMMEKSLRNASTRISRDLNDERRHDAKIAKGEFLVKNSIGTQRRLSADLVTTKAQLGIKSRDEGRKLLSTQNRIQNTSAHQTMLNREADHLAAELHVKNLENKLHEAGQKKQALIDNVISEKRKRDTAKEKTLSDKFQVRALEEKEAQHRDFLNHIEKIVAKDDDIESNLFSKVHNAELARTAEEKEFRKLHTKLLQTRRTHKQRLLDESMKMANKERELEQRLQRQKSELSKIHAEREYNYQILQKHRRSVREDEFQLEEIRKQRDRVLKIRSHTTLD